VLSLMDHLDSLLRALVAEEFGAREYRYPTLISADVLRRTGYFESFPQMVMSVSRLHGDIDSYRGFLDALAGGDDLQSALGAHSGGFDHCLPPTMCFHTYHQFADAPLPAPSAVVTARGKSFRNESRYRRSLERLWDFTIREVVFLGTPEFVLDARRRLMERAYGLVDALGLSGRCEVAGDPFFLNDTTAARAWSQRLLELKYELRLPLGGEREVSVGSFNYHEQFFGKSFGIGGAGGEPVFTGCAGFGLERFAYAFLCRHGLDPARWPEAVRAAVAP
jgi:seryl-tRNA synthetase